MKRIQRIVVGTDFSEIADAALEGAVYLAERLGAAITLVHAYELSVYGFPDGALITTADVAGKLANAAQQGLFAAADRHKRKGVTIDTVVRVGRAWEEVNAVAADLRADLIVVGTHGRRGFARAFLGSVAERLLRTASCPVLVVPGKEGRT
jgi:nucleotide-binding universal stress UspA family protein